MISDDGIYVTSFGIISAIGNDGVSTLESLLHCRSGIAPVRHLSTALRDIPVGEVKLSDIELVAANNITGTATGLRSSLLGIHAARQALASRRLPSLRHTAFISGTTVGGMDNTERYFERIYKEDADAELTIQLEYNDCGYSTRLIAESTRAFGMTSTVSTACSSAANAIAHGADLIRAGVVDNALAGGTECLSRFHLNGFNSLMILDSRRCRPFSADRAGINLGEGAAYLLLERGADIKAAGIQPLARLSGYANACDAFHQTATSDNGEGAFLSMTKALEMARLRPSDISYINAHGTGTPNNDITELAAMQRIWGNNLPPYSSTKSLTGHTTSASGAIEAVISILALRHGFLPAGINGPEPLFPTCQPIGRPVSASVKHVISNSFGFGGNDTTLIFSAPDLP